MEESAQEIPTLWAVGRVEWRRVAAVGREEVERAVWPLLVVMAAVDAEHVLEVTRPRIRIRSRQSERSVRTQRSAWAFAFGAWIGVRITLMPSVRKRRRRHS